MTHLVKLIFRPAMPAWTEPSYDDKCNDPKKVFDRIADWGANYLQNCRSGAPDRLANRMKNWTAKMFLRTDCGYRWVNANHRMNNGHRMEPGTYIIDNRCNPDWVSKNGADCQAYGDGGFCYNTRYTTDYWFSEFGQHLLPLTGFETEYGIQTAYSCPQCGCTDVMNADDSTKPKDALYATNPSG